MAEMGDQSFRLGNIYENGYDSWIESPACRATCSASLLETLPTCCDCVYQPYCGVRPVVNYALEGSLFASAPNNDRCRIYRGMIDNLMEYLQRNDEKEMRILKSWLKKIMGNESRPQDETLRGTKLRGTTPSTASPFSGRCGCAD